MIRLFFNRQRNILDYALGSLWRNGLKNSGIFLVFSLVIFLIGSFRLVTASLDRASETLLASVPDLIVQKMTAGRQDVVLLEDLGRVKELFGIKDVTPRIWGYYFDESSGANYTVIGIQDSDNLESFSGSVIEYRMGAIDKEETSLVVIGQAVLEQKNLVGRNHFSLFRPDLSLKSFQVRGSFSKASEIVTADLIIMELEAARDLFSLQKDEVTDLLVNVGNPVEIDTIARKISERIPGSRVITKKQIQKTYKTAFGWRSGFGLICLLGSVAAFIVLAWDKASGLSEEQRKEVAVLKAIGWQTTDIMTVRFWESVVVSTSAFVIGILLAWAHILFLKAFLFTPILLGWSVIKPSLNLVPSVHGSDVLLIFIISVLPYLTATVIPAWKSALIRPDSIV